jgi:hypothetical protein
VDTRVAVVWQRKIVSIAAHIAKQSRRAPKFPASAGIRNVLEKLIESTKYRSIFNRTLNLSAMIGDTIV